jgi:hypothetical protein
MMTGGVRKDLKSLPGGFVELRQMSYSEMLARRDIVTRLSMSQKKDNDKIDVELANLAANRFSFAKCIVDHNLEDEFGQKLDFQNTMTLEVLDPRVGVEIEQYIDELNQDAEDEEQEDFTPPATSSYEDNPTELSPTVEHSS